MRAVHGTGAAAETAMRAQILAVLEELCRDVTLHDVREWYLDSLAEPCHAPASPACRIE